MLVEFSVENFRSIKNRVTLSMIASTDKSLSENLIDDAKGINENLLRSAVIYGANASGKTNVVKAMDFMINLIKRSHRMQKGESIGITPFKLDRSYVKNPSVFDIIFIQNGVRYSYGFSLDDKRIYDEYLYSYPNGRKKIIFERTHTNDYVFKSDLEEQRTLSSRTLENVLYLSSSTQWNYKPASEAFEWFNNKINVITSHDYRLFMGYIGKLIFEDDSMKKKVNELIRKVDFGINEIMSHKVPLLINNPPFNIIEGFKVELKVELDEEFKEKLKDSSHFKTSAIHKIINLQGEEETIEFQIEDESAGTQKFLGFLSPLILALEHGKVLIIDELDARLHPTLTKSVVEMFNSRETNPYNAQLIFNTHDTNLLNLELFRRDQIWFTEKKGDGSTDLYSLLEYKPRKDENIQKGYLNGRYGAIPFIREEHIL